MEHALLDSYESAIKRISKSHGTRRRLDVMAMDQEDYEAVLRVTSIELQHEFRRRHGFNVNAERRYVHKGLWNASSQFGRVRTRRSRLLEHYVDVEIPEATQMRELEEQYEAKDAIRRLKRKMNPDDYQILHRVARSDHLTDAWDEDIDGAFRSFTRRVRKLQARASKILAN